MNEPLAMMLRYNAWAMNALIEACRELTDTHLDAPPIPGATGTVREMILHACGGQEVFAWRASGQGIRPDRDDYAEWRGWQWLSDAVRASGERLITPAAALEEDSPLDYEYLGKTYRFPRSFFLAHAVAHGDQHRSEIKLALAALGVPTPDLDGWNWAADTGIGGEV